MNLIKEKTHKNNRCKSNKLTRQKLKEISDHNSLNFLS